MASSPLVAIARNIITINSSKLRKSSQSLPTRIKKQAVVARSSVYPARLNHSAQVCEAGPPRPKEIRSPTNTRSALRM